MSKPPLLIDEIRALLPHRYPMLLVDRVLEIGPDSVVAEKLVTSNDPFLQGHFPDRPIMPGVLIIEALAQASGVWVRYTYPEKRQLGMALVGVNKARFRKPVVPGDTLELHVRLVRQRGDIIVVDASARVLGESAAEAELMAAFIDWDRNS